MRVYFCECRPPIIGYSVTNHNSLVEVIPVHGSGALDRLPRGVADPPPAGCAWSAGAR